MAGKLRTPGDQLRIISTNLTRLMERNSVTQRELSEVVGLSESAVSKWISCSNSPNMGSIQKIADYFRVSISDIVEEKDDEDYSNLVMEGRFLMDAIPNMTPAKQRRLKQLYDFIESE